MPVPADLRASLEIHNGQKNSRKWLGLMDGWRLMTCSEIADWSKGMARLSDEGDFEDREVSNDPSVKPDWWNKRWVPFLESGSGDCLCVDMDPAEAGVPGQVIEFNHDYESRPARASSLGAYLSEFLDDLRNDNYGVDDDSGGLEN